MPFPDLSHPLSAIKTATGNLICVHDLISFSVHHLFLICFVENLLANIIAYAIIFVMIFVFGKRPTDTLLLLITSNDYTSICVHCTLVDDHAIQILSYVSLVALLYIYNLIRTLYCLLDSLLAILRCLILFLHLLHLRL